jgi:hypothetical protein
MALTKEELEALEELSAMEHDADEIRRIARARTKAAGIFKTPPASPGPSKIEMLHRINELEQQRDHARREARHWRDRFDETQKYLMDMAAASAPPLIVTASEPAAPNYEGQKGFGDF